MALRQNDEAKNSNLEEIYSNMLACETHLSEHKDLITYAERSIVFSNGDTDQDK